MRDCHGDTNKDNEKGIKDKREAFIHIIITKGKSDKTPEHISSG